MHACKAGAPGARISRTYTWAVRGSACCAASATRARVQSPAGAMTMAWLPASASAQPLSRGPLTAAKLCHCPAQWVEMRPAVPAGACPGKPERTRQERVCGTAAATVRRRTQALHRGVGMVRHAATWCAAEGCPLIRCTSALTHQQLLGLQ